jgi:uncharacterized protein (DUF58 family)
MSSAVTAQPPQSDGTAIDLRDLLALRQESRHLHIALRGKVLATRSGGHLSRFRGRGMEFDESRIYQPGDDPRNMDWRVTARAGRPHVKLFREERERPVWLLADLGPGMRFGTRVAFKSVIAAQAAALLAWAAADQGDRVGGLVFDESRDYEGRPAARTRGLLPLLNGLSELSRSPGENAGARLGTGYASLSMAAEQLSRLVRPGSLVFVLSDFTGLGREREETWLGRLSAGSEVVLVRIYDPLEALPPPPGRYPVTDGRRRGLLDTRQTERRERWQHRFEELSSKLENLSLGHHAHLIELRTDQPVGETLSLGLRPLSQRRGPGR